jgi:tRNA(adenine34) deaminase
MSPPIESTAMSEILPSDEYAMRIALDQAHNAWLVGEVPVGAVGSCSVIGRL